MISTQTQEYGTYTAPDMVRIERALPGPIERVWSYLTDAEKRRTWLAGGDMDLRPGGRFELVWRNSELTPDDDPPPPKFAKHAKESRMQGHIVECEPPRRLVFTFGEQSEVTFELSPRGKEVHLVVTHRRLPSRDEVLSVSGGWHAHLDVLAARLEGRTPEGFWRNVARLNAEYDRRIPRS